MIEPRCIRIFRTREQAELAQEVLKEAGISSRIKEDGFGKLTLKDLDMPSRFRLYIPKDEIDNAATFLAQKLSKKIAK